MKYSYNNRSSVRNYHKKIREGFERFHSMNAQARTFGIDENGSRRWLVMQFVSYDTNICQIVYDYKYDSVQVYCNDDPFNWSCTTSRQLSRWLYESYMINFDSSTLRMAYRNAHSVTPDVSLYRYYNTTFEFRSSDTFNTIWR